MAHINKIANSIAKNKQPNWELLKHFLVSSTFLFVSVETWKAHSLLTSAISIIFLSFFYFRSFALMHDAVHGAVHPNKFINHGIGILMGACCFLPYWPWRKLHLDHHRWSGNIDKDPVMKLVKDFPHYSHQKQKKLNFAWRAWIPYMAFLQYVVFWMESIKRLRVVDSKIDFSYNAASVVVGIVIYTALLPLMGLSGLGLSVLSILSYLVLVEIINFPHHLSLPQFHGNYSLPFLEQYKIARSCHYPRLFAHHLLNNFNYHTEHHMFPHIPWYHLGELRAVVKHHLGSAYNESRGSQWIIKNKQRNLLNVLDYQTPTFSDQTNKTAA